MPTAASVVRGGGKLGSTGTGLRLGGGGGQPEGWWEGGVSGENTPDLYGAGGEDLGRGLLQFERCLGEPQHLGGEGEGKG